MAVRSISKYPFLTSCTSTTGKPGGSAARYTEGFTMSKLVDYFSSDDIDNNEDYALKVGASVGTWALIFFHIAPMLVTAGKLLFGINPHQMSTGSGFTDIFLYYILSSVIATLIVRWQNRKLAKKPGKFRKKYVLLISFIFLIFALLRISSSFLFKS
jgi:hypothetical protein